MNSETRGVADWQAGGALGPPGRCYYDNDALFAERENNLIQAGGAGVQPLAHVRHRDRYDGGSTRGGGIRPVNGQGDARQSGWAEAGGRRVVVATFTPFTG